MPYRRLLVGAAWLLLGGIAFVTLSPIGLRPITGLSANTERLIAWLALGFVFGLAYPRQRLLIGVILALAAIGFELGQHLVIGRHGRMLDGLVKVAGAAIGLGVSMLVDRLTMRRPR